MIDLNLDPGELWFGSDFLLKKAISEKLFQAANYEPGSRSEVLEKLLSDLLKAPKNTHFYFFKSALEIRCLLAGLNDYPNKKRQTTAFVQLINVKTGARANLEQTHQADEVLIADVSYAIPNTELPWRNCDALIFEAHKGLGVIPGLAILMLPDDSKLLPAKELLKVAQYPLPVLNMYLAEHIAEQISSFDTSLRKVDFKVKTTLIHQFVDAASGIFEPVCSKSEQSDELFVLDLGIHETAFKNYLMEKGFLISTKSNRWYLPNYIVHSRESFYQLHDEVVNWIQSVQKYK